VLRRTARAPTARLQQACRAADAAPERRVRFAASLGGERSVAKPHKFVRVWLRPTLALILAVCSEPLRLETRVTDDVS
jgi:hypothetical protein